MAATMRSETALSTKSVKRNIPHELLIIGLILWAALGPIAGIAYEHHVNTKDWFDIAGFTIAQQDDMRVQYFSQAAFTYFAGAIVWFAGVMALAMGSWFTRTRD